MEDNPILIFDFDCTIVDVDSDPWVAQQLGATALMNDLLSRLPWNDMMDELMEDLHAKGTAIRDIEEALRCIPLQPEKIETIKLAHAKGCELHIVSDANCFFIKTILDKHNVTHLFTEIHTNPASIDAAGRLHIAPFHSKCEAAHCCPLCPPNMCKGIILNYIQSQVAHHRRIIYVGDGSGDFCPSLRLKKDDCILPRENYPLLTMLLQNMPKVKANVYPWDTAKNLQETVAMVIDSPRVLQAEHGFEGVCDETCANCAFKIMLLEQEKAMGARSSVFA